MLEIINAQIEIKIVTRCKLHKCDLFKIVTQITKCF